MHKLNFKQIKVDSHGDYIVTFDIVVDKFDEAVRTKEIIETDLKNSLENQTTLD